MVPQLKIQGHFIDLPPEQFYEYWIGTAYTTCLVGGILGGYLDPRKNGHSVLDLHASFLIENVPRIDDPGVRELFLELLYQFNQIVTLDKLAFEKLSAELRLPVPTTMQDWRLFNRKLRSVLRERYGKAGKTYLEDPALRGLMPSFIEITSATRKTKLEIVSRILTLFSALSKSEYIHPSDCSTLDLRSN